MHADHGEALGEDDYWFRHGSLLHDVALRVPFVLAGPGFGEDGIIRTVHPIVRTNDDLEGHSWR